MASKARTRKRRTPSGIYIKPKNRGKFTRWVKRNMPGRSVQEAARIIMNAPEGKYSAAVRKMANFARNASKFRRPRRVQR